MKLKRFVLCFLCVLVAVSCAAYGQNRYNSIDVAVFRNLLSIMKSTPSAADHVCTSFFHNEAARDIHDAIKDDSQLLPDLGITKLEMAGMRVKIARELAQKLTIQLRSSMKKDVKCIYGIDLTKLQRGERLDLTDLYDIVMAIERLLKQHIELTTSDNQNIANHVERRRAVVEYARQEGPGWVKKFMHGKENEKSTAHLGLINFLVFEHIAPSVIGISPEVAGHFLEKYGDKD